MHMPQYASLKMKPIYYSRIEAEWRIYLFQPMLFMVYWLMMTSSYGDIFRVTGHLWPPVNSPYKGQWRGALVFSLICAWINCWVNNCEAGDLRRHRAHYDIIVITLGTYCCELWIKIHSIKTFENVICKLLVILFWCQCVDRKGTRGRIWSTYFLRRL